MTYIGNSPSCYANTLAMTIGVPISAPMVDVLTSSAFGYQRIGALPLFDPPGWDPDQGLEQALGIMGVDHERMTFEDPDDAIAVLRRLAKDGPVFVGPLDMGLLRHQGGSDRPTGADHFVAVLDVNDERVVMHDPQGHPFAALAVTDFQDAWGSETIGYAEGRFPLRTSFTAPIGVADEWVAASLPYALEWAEGGRAIPNFPPGNQQGLGHLADEARSGAVSDVTADVLRSFALRLGARRRSDAADAFHDYRELASLLRHQGEVIGGGQLEAIDSDWKSFSRRLDDLAELHVDALVELRAIAGRSALGM